MFIRRNLYLFILALSLSGINAFAQTETTARSTQAASPAAAAITASAVEGGGVRFNASAEALQLRFELYNAAGERVFDSGARPGNILDWHPSSQPQGTPDGSYLCVVTVKDLQGRTRQRLGTLSVQSGQASVQRVREQDLPEAQKQVLAANGRAAEDADNSLTILKEGKMRAATVAAHDGKEGSITSTTGALSLRTGDIFSAQDREQVRITPDGRVGVGTDTPEATLDVAGTIRARKGIEFPDGTVQTTAAVSSGLPGKDSTITPLAAGTGTAGRLAKWSETGGAGTLSDSALFESGGRIGLGTSTPSYPFHIASPTFGQAYVSGGSGADLLLYHNNAAANSRWTGVRSQNGFGKISSFNDDGNFRNEGIVTWNNLNGNVGIGNQNPGAKLDVAGAARYTGTNVVPSGAAGDGLELWYWTGSGGPYGLVLSYNRGTSTYKPLWIAGDYLSFQQGATERMRVHTNGNIGIGTATPTQRLEVVGNLQLSGATNGIIFPDGSKMTTAGGGGAPSGTSIITAINDPATTGTIGDGRLSTNVARLNGANNWAGANIFNFGLSANNSLISNVGNPVNAGDAVNKAYTDANFIKFVPGAEQLSVGDANGTAPMINLRGGSTCCSGPGGHTPAFFKVFQNGSFVATGNLGIGVSPMQGKGYRTSWDSYKGAFRSGYADNEWDDATVGFFSWAGGSNSTAEGLYALAFGDTNFARSTSSIAFGSGNEVKGAAGFSAGAGNRVCDTYGVAFGNKAQSGGPLINGKCDPDTFNIRGLSAVAIGYNVTADQDHTTAMGKFATNNGFSGTFIWSDGSAQASADTFRNTANNEFAARATGGFRFRTNLGGTTGCNLPAGSGVFNCTSSRTTKENFKLASGEDVLTRLRKIPVSTWNYTAEGSSVRHMGPMAEDFYQQFGLGTGNTSIGVQDLAGVSLAAVKALDQRTATLQQRTAEVEQLRSEVQTLRAANAAMEQRLAALEQNMRQENAPKPRATAGRRR